MQFVIIDQCNILFLSVDVSVMFIIFLLLKKVINIKFIRIGIYKLTTRLPSKFLLLLFVIMFLY